MGKAGKMKRAFVIAALCAAALVSGVVTHC
jgi:hypothetical protein